MKTRGVTRPVALQDAQGDGQHEGHDPEQMLEMHHRNTLWIPWTLILLGFWVLLAPFTLGYLNESLWAQPSGGRDMPVASGRWSGVILARWRSGSMFEEGGLSRRSPKIRLRPL